MIEVIRRTAKEKHSTLYLMNEAFRYETLSVRENEQKFRFTGPFREFPEVTISMNGPHQIKNAAVALMTIEVLRQYYAMIVEEEDLLRAMNATQWPGRLELISTHPRILIDGAHNPEGAETLASAIKTTYSYKKLHLMMGMLSNKNHTEYFRHILPIVDTLILTEPVWFKKAGAAGLASLARTLLEEIGRTDVEVIVEPNWKTALEIMNRLTAQDDLAVVTGTLYLIGDVRSWIKHQSDSEKGW
ncbi:hypothetical protein LJK87_25375 [Paenibacillus sp. P25]|nr:hypothetical protein LJK87_25375 [Paenibacillus sp. P25]